MWFQNSTLIPVDIYLIKQQKDWNIQEIRSYISALFPFYGGKKNSLKKSKNESKYKTNDFWSWYKIFSIIICYMELLVWILRQKSW